MKNTLIVTVVTSLCLSIAAELAAATYQLDGQANVAVSDLSSAVEVQLPSAGTYTLTLVASDFRENAGNPAPQRHVLVHGNSVLGDLRSFTLNGVGDSQTVTIAGATTVRLLFLDIPPVSDNAGTSLVAVEKDGAALGTWTVDSQANACGADIALSAVAVHLPYAGEYTFGLPASDFRENSGTPSPQSHVVIHSNSRLGDDRTFSLNGLGDSQTVIADGPTTVYLLFLDAPPIWDNTGSSTVDMTGLVEIKALDRNGELTWCAPVGSICTILWAGNLASGEWNDNWVDCQNITMTNECQSVTVPMVYSIRAVLP